MTGSGGIGAVAGGRYGGGVTVANGAQNSGDIFMSCACQASTCQDACLLPLCVAGVLDLDAHGANRRLRSGRFGVDESAFPG